MRTTIGSGGQTLSLETSLVNDVVSVASNGFAVYLDVRGLRELAAAATAHADALEANPKLKHW